MNQNCLFCRIINNEIPAKKIYEDDTTLSFLDIQPNNPGHSLIIPKEHHENFLEMPDKIMEDFFPKMKLVANAIKKGVNADGINISQNNGKASGQVIFHVHFHIIPRYLDDGLKNWPHKKLSELEMEEIKGKIVSAF